ncbi:alpha-2-macroglobulin family protein [Chelatococcus asaccharovorans]|uniref:Alpha-2-macroglobulin family protein n=1 Tax=Chelatococcus asaccharovorans TaxID=28210 RepID=A0A2V3U2R2_9HYPH|nr:alpha-2-macroglobulin [Chelatococcus asaccharovorans]MBS7702462.1 alpha-2-macroglobulin family protein [Chelatococcus asaccharovorans]PXW56330.1 hypothetical protein C7450_10879 [Chelatococcus asaccharovorans]
MTTSFQNRPVKTGLAGLVVALGLACAPALVVAPAGEAFAQASPPARPANPPATAPTVPQTAPAPARKTYSRDDLASVAVRLEADIKREVAPPPSAPAGQPGQAGQVGQAPRPAPQPDRMRQEAQAALGRGDTLRALALYGNLIAQQPNNVTAWLGYSAAAAQSKGANYSENQDFRRRALGAAYAGYQKATTAAQEATALADLGALFAQYSQWRSAIDTYRASLASADIPARRGIYDNLVASHGFRLIGNSTDSDSATPRACFQFSEPLQQGKVDFTPFVAITGASNAAVTGEGSQICVDGLKHGERYAIVIRRGLPSAIEGEALQKNADYEIYVKDRGPQVRFTGRNYVLPRTGQQGIPIVSVNTPKIDVEVLRVGDRSLLPTVRSDDFLSQISRYTADSYADDKGQRVWRGTLDVANVLNKDVITAFPVMEAVGGKLEPGVYLMTAAASGGPKGDGDYELRATQWFVVSDLGLTSISGSGGVEVMLRSLGNAAPLDGVEVRLLARNNDVLGVEKSDAQGRVRFSAGLARGTGGQAPGLVVASTAAGDYNFLDLGQSAFDLSDRGVKGRRAAGALDAMVFTERGVYRTGETVYVTALLRDGKGVAAPNLPVTLVARRPDGVEYRRSLVADQGEGGRAWSLPILGGAMRGTWRLQAYADPKGQAIGETSFLVEDYVPERIDVTLTPTQKALQAGEPATIAVDARYLYGAPGADLDVSGEVSVTASATPTIPGLDGFEIGLADEEFSAVTTEIEQHFTTDAQGHVVVEVPIGEISAPRPVEAKITLRVGETGGRAVERSVTLPILPEGNVIGARKLFTELAEGGTASFDVVMATPTGERLSGGVQWNLYRLDRDYQWYNNDGRWSYETVTRTRRIADGRVNVTAGSAGRIAATVGWGRYRLELASVQPDVQPTSISFGVGWGGEQTADSPDRLDVTLDKAAFASGEEMTVTVRPRFAGTATVAVVTDHVLEERLVDVTPDGTSVKLPVSADWGAGAYLVAFAHRPLDEAAKRMPGRALGLAWFSVDAAARDLNVGLGAPPAMRPRETLRLPIKVAGALPGEKAYVTVAAVDVGILNLTRYEAPRPGDYFFGQRQLGAEIRDLYGFLIDGMQGTRGAIRSGGDGGAQVSGSPPAQEPVSLYSGVVEVGADGTAEVAFDIPDFNGTLRVMATAWTKSRVGQASADVIVRDPVVMVGTLPRFLNIGDNSRFAIDINNVEGEAGTYKLSLSSTGPVAIPANQRERSLQLAKGARQSLSVPISGASVGIATIEARLTGPGFDGPQTFRIGVQPGRPPLINRTVRPLAAQASVRLTPDLFADLLPGTGLASISVSPMTALDVPALLASLDRFPYGCTEQTVSRALPLLYVNALSAVNALPTDTNLDERIRTSIERVLARQDSNGSFGLWSVGGDDIWLDAYVTDFLTRAREGGFVVPQIGFDLALDRLRNFVANQDFTKGSGEDLAYAVYVLARNGRPVMGDLRYLADVRIKDFGSPLAQSQIAAALALLGDRGRAQAAFTTAVSALGAAVDKPVSRPDYGSRLRDGAAVLTLAAEAGAQAADITAVGRVVEDARARRSYTSTQEEAWMVLAAEAMTKRAEGIRVTVNGTPHAGALYRNLRADALGGAGFTVANAGSTPLQMVVSVAGNPLTPEPAASRGYSIARNYYKLDGTQVDPAHVNQNDRLVVTLKVTETEAAFARLLLVDYLPAGFEIDNPNLVDSGSVAGLDWLKRDVEPSHTEYRDDRFVAAFDRDGGKAAFFTVAYMVRAVSPGTFVHPPAVVEDMYRPERFGRGDFGKVEVTAVR